MNNEIMNKIEDFVCEKNKRYAYHRAQNINKKRCGVCGLFGCICQTKITNYQNKPKIRKEVCPICGFYLCDCV